MKNEFVAAITQLSAEKNLNSDTVFVAVEAALSSSFRKDDLQYASIETKIDRITGDISAWQTWAILDDDEIEDDENQELCEKLKIKYKVTHKIDSDIVGFLCLINGLPPGGPSGMLQPYFFVSFFKNCMRG